MCLCLAWAGLWLPVWRAAVSSFVLANWAKPSAPDQAGTTQNSSGGWESGRRHRTCDLAKTDDWNLSSCLQMGAMECVVHKVVYPWKSFSTITCRAYHMSVLFKLGGACTLGGPAIWQRGVQGKTPLRIMILVHFFNTSFDQQKAT